MKCDHLNGNEKFPAAETAFLRSANGLDRGLKLKIVEILTHLIARGKKPFGLLIVLGWQSRWQKFAVTPDISQDVFAGHTIGDRRGAEMRERERGIEMTTAFDGAILIDARGTVLHSGVMIEGLRPREAAAKLNPGTFSDLSVQFGFAEKVHTRHLTAITASYAFKGTTVFTVSEESGSIHVFENGKIVYTSKKIRTNRQKPKR